MIRAPVLRLGLVILLCSAGAFALAQQSQPTQQRSRTTADPKPAAQSQTNGQRGAQPKPAAGSASQQKPGATAKPAAGPTPAKPGAAAQGKPAAQGPGGGQATLLATFSDWNAYASGSGRTKVCYALSLPKERMPKDLKRDPAYLFVSFRPADNVRNEVAVVMGFATKEGGPAEAVVGTATYALVTKGTNAWIRNPTEEAQVIAAFSRGKDVIVKAASARGNATTDRYSLAGFAQALDRARKECA